MKIFNKLIFATVMAVAAQPLFSAETNWEREAWLTGTKHVTVRDSKQHKPNQEAIQAIANLNWEKLETLCSKTNPLTNPNLDIEIVNFCSSKGHAQHTFYLGMKEENFGSKKTAREYYKISADGGLPIGAVFYAEALTDGMGGPTNFKDAEKYYRKIEKLGLFDMPALYARLKQAKEQARAEEEAGRRYAEAWEIAEQLRRNSTIRLK